ncbi:MAG: toll/interleukin-1 receptor domain-containing protein [bacterium]|nr:toll/interleukin-1 receptor domain-containing protein [bacterium]
MNGQSERIHTIRAVAEVLGAEDWSIIDMTLEAFGCPTLDTWSGNTRDYVLEMVLSAPEPAVIALAEHLDLVAQPMGEVGDADCWEEGYFRLFLSHLARHKVFAHELKSELASRAISGFVAHDDITPTAEWISEIESALFSADALVALMHEGFENSYWTDQEVGVVMGRRKPILSVKLETDPHGFLGKFQAIPGGAAETVAARIFSALVSREDTARAIAYAVVHRTERGRGHNDNQDNFRLLGQISYFDDTLAKRLRTAMDESHYVAEAYNKITIMTKLFDRFGYQLDYEE